MESQFGQTSAVSRHTPPDLQPSFLTPLESTSTLLAPACLCDGACKTCKTCTACTAKAMKFPGNGLGHRGGISASTSYFVYLGTKYTCHCHSLSLVTASTETRPCSARAAPAAAGRRNEAEKPSGGTHLGKSRRDTTTLPACSQNPSVMQIRSPIPLRPFLLHVAVFRISIWSLRCALQRHFPGLRSVSMPDHAETLLDRKIDWSSLV